MDYDSYGQANLAFCDDGLWFSQKGVATGHQWVIRDLAQYGLYGQADDMDLVVDGSDMVWIGYIEQNTLKLANYDPVTLGWNSGVIDYVPPMGSAHFTMETDGLGGIGVAYIDAGGFLKYSYNDGGGFWSSETVMNFETSEYIMVGAGDSDIGLVYDTQNNPVISYRDMQTGELSLAYDPVAIPEPATLALLVLGATIIHRRRCS